MRLTFHPRKCPGPRVEGLSGWAGRRESDTPRPDRNGRPHSVVTWIVRTTLGRAGIEPTAGDDTGPPGSGYPRSLLPEDQPEEHDQARQVDEKPRRHVLSSSQITRGSCAYSGACAGSASGVASASVPAAGLPGRTVRVRVHRKGVPHRSGPGTWPRRRRPAVPGTPRGRGRTRRLPVRS